MDKSVKDTIEDKHTTIENDIPTKENDYLKVRLNKEHVLIVNKKKLLEKSDYFRSITKLCFSDHKSEFTEITMPVSFDSFKKVINYISTDVVDVRDSCVLEVVLLSDYLQIDCIIEICFEQFVSKLNTKTLDQQLAFMRNCSMLFKDFIDVALKFKKSGRPYFEGVYVLEHFPKMYAGKYNIRLLNEESDYIVSLEYFFHCLSNLMYLCSSLIMVKVKVLGSTSLLQYDLITGSLHEICGEYNNFLKVCTDNNYLYVLNPVKDKVCCKFSLSKLGRKNIYEALSVFNTKVFTLFNLYLPRSHKSYNITILFSFCNDKNLYFFYEPDYMKYFSNLYEYFCNVHFVTICINTMTLISDKTLDECIRFNTGENESKFTKENIKQIDNIDFELLFVQRGAQKVVMKVTNWYHEDIVLVFDMKICFFYLAESINPNQKSRSEARRFGGDERKVIYKGGKDDLVYMYKFDDSYKRYKNELEIRAFKYNNDKLIDTGVSHKILHSDYHTTNFCVV